MPPCSIVADEGYQVTAVVVARDGRVQALLRHALASPVTLKIAKKKAKTSGKHAPAERGYFKNLGANKQKVDPDAWRVADRSGRSVLRRSRGLWCYWGN